LGRPIDGILGHDFFRRFVTELDWDAQVVRIHDTSGYQPPTGAQAIPLRFERRVPYLEATLTVEGHPPERRTLLLDTGSEDAVDDSHRRVDSPGTEHQSSCTSIKAHPAKGGAAKLRVLASSATPS
jgi:hypothetical protein